MALRLSGSPEKDGTCHRSADECTGRKGGGREPLEEVACQEPKDDPDCVRTEQVGRSHDSSVRCEEVPS